MADTKKFLNPFNKGVNYKQFLNSVPEKTTVADYCKGNLEKEQIEWLLNDLQHYKKNIKAQQDAEKELETINTEE